MLAETFQKPKPILGKVQLLALPGAPGWDGHWDDLCTRAEQEATALATGGVDGILVENTHDVPYTAERIDMAGAIALAMLVQRIRRFTQLPVGLSVLQNDPETALAVAMNTQAAFIRLPLLSGALITESGVIQSKLNELLHYKNRLRTQLPLILVDVSPNHMVPEHAGDEPAHDLAELNHAHLAHVTRTFAQKKLAGAVIIADHDLEAGQLEAFKKEVPLPVLIENRQADTLKDRNAYYQPADGLILDTGIRKQGARQTDKPPTIDMTKVEEIVKHLRNIPSVTEMDPDIFLSR